MDIEKAWRRTFGQNRNENAKMDSRSYVEKQEAKWRYPSHPRSSVHHEQGTGGQVEMVWACTTPRRGGLCQENLGRQTYVDNGVGENRGKGGWTSWRPTWRTCGSTWWTWKIEPSGDEEPVWLTPHPRDLNQPEGEREKAAKPLCSRTFVDFVNTKFGISNGDSAYT